MLKLVSLYFLLGACLFALDTNEKVAFNDLLSHSKIYIDKTKSATIKDIRDKNFQKNSEKIIGYGYSPDFNVWIRVNITNSSQQIVHKIIEYGNPLTSFVEFYDGTNDELLLRDGLLATDKERGCLSPILPITLQAGESKILYIKAHSDITTLIVQLKLWDIHAFYKNKMKNIFILALFFGAMGIIFIYNFIIYLSTRDKSYLYYVLSFVGLTFYYLLYKGVGNVYLFPPEIIEELIKFSSFIVAFPIFFLALFTKAILNLPQYPRINRILNYILILFPIVTLLFFLLDINLYRSLFPIMILLYLASVTFYAFTQNNRLAKYILAGWFVFFSAGLFMFLSSLGVYDIFVTYPNYVEFSFVVESVAFSCSLADRLKQLQREKLAAEETVRLSTMVATKTKDLETLLDEKQLLLRELNHRVKNSMQTIISFLRLQRDDSEDRERKIVLQNLENRIFAINDLYTLLQTTEKISTVNAYNYFALLIDNLSKSFHNPNITIELNTDIDIKSDDAVYCGFILNEAITNSYQHAFSDTESGDVKISLSKENGSYHFIIKDNGVGYTQIDSEDTLGLMIIHTLAEIQLDGEIAIDSSHGLEIAIVWSDNG